MNQPSDSDQQQNEGDSPPPESHEKVRKKLPTAAGDKSAQVLSATIGGALIGNLIAPGVGGALIGGIIGAIIARKSDSTGGK
ncbi:MAG: hypothetical protein KF800_13760 [Lysobacter sp.]|nr:hypothetical protein [Lysobacter sp.]